MLFQRIFKTQMDTHQKYLKMLSKYKKLANIHLWLLYWNHTRPFVRATHLSLRFLAPARFASVYLRVIPFFNVTFVYSNARNSFDSHSFEYLLRSFCSPSSLFIAINVMKTKGSKFRVANFNIRVRELRLSKFS